MKQLLTAILFLLSLSLLAQNSLNKAPHKDSVAKYIGNGVYLTVTGCIGDEASQKITLYFTLTNPSKAHQKIKIDPWNEVPVGAYDADGNQFPFGNVSLGNQTAFGQVESELPTGLMVKGYISFINIHNKPKKVAHIAIPVSSGNWPSASDLLQEIIEIDNVKVNWDANTFPYEDVEAKNKNIEYTKDGYTKSFCNGLDFYYTGCKGDAAAQTVTIYFVMANYNKANQKVLIDPYSSKRAFAFDNIGNSYSFDRINIVNESSEGSLDFMIPTGLFVKGSITFKNVLPVANSLGIVNFSAKAENWNGSGNEIEDAIQLNNLKINWGAADNPNADFKPTKKTSVTASAITNEITIVPNKTRTLENDLDLMIVGCEGDSVDQSVTLFYTIANPRKPNQRVELQSYSNDPIMAFDAYGNQYKLGNLNLEEGNSTDNVRSVLPTGMTVNGSVTFVNVYPLVSNFSMIKIPVKAGNSDGDNSNEKAEMVYLKNIKIKWKRIKPKEDEGTNQVKPKWTPKRKSRY